MITYIAKCPNCKKTVEYSECANCGRRSLKYFSNAEGFINALFCRACGIGQGSIECPECKCEISATKFYPRWARMGCATVVFLAALIAGVFGVVTALGPIETEPTPVSLRDLDPDNPPDVQWLAVDGYLSWAHAVEHWRKLYVPMSSTPGGDWRAIVELSKKDRDSLRGNSSTAIAGVWKPASKLSDSVQESLRDKNTRISIPEMILIDHGSEPLQRGPAAVFAIVGGLYVFYRIRRRRRRRA